MCEKLPEGRFERADKSIIIEEKIAFDIRQLRKKGYYAFLSIIFKTKDEARKIVPLYIDMVEDAKILFDRDNFFTNVLEGLRSRLNELGSRRVWKENGWYWILKPDYKYGEVFEIWPMQVCQKVIWERLLEKV